jgi:hypothetical protein
MLMKLAIYVVTGSRAWFGDPEVIRRSLVDFGERHQGFSLLLYHGDCPHGSSGQSVDQLARGFAAQLRWEVNGLPADWRKGQSAGPDRNKHMIQLAAAARDEGAIVEVHAFPSAKSKGTWNCLHRAKSHSLTSTVHREGLSPKG